MAEIKRKLFEAFKIVLQKTNQFQLISGMWCSKAFVYDYPFYKMSENLPKIEKRYFEIQIGAHKAMLMICPLYMSLFLEKYGRPFERNNTIGFPRLKIDTNTN